MRRMSSARLAPTFSLICLKPATTASLQRRRSFSSSYPSHPGDVEYAGYPSRSSVSVRSARPGAAFSSRSSASAGVSASVRYRKSTSDTMSAGGISASSNHNGLPARLAARSHTALTTAEMAMCMTPFSGPSQRSCESCTSSFQNPPRSPITASSDRPTRNGRSASIAVAWTSLPRPMVNAKPWPSSPSPASVRSTT
jgi:hypothetical protein